MSDPALQKGYKVRIEADALIRKLQAYPEIYVEEMEKGMQEGLYILEQAAKAEAPTFMGHLRASITTEVVIDHPKISGRVGPSLKDEIYPLVMEIGRRPGQRPPPASALIRWVELEIPSAADPEQTARRIAFMIGRKGIKGRRYMQKAAESKQDQVAAKIRAALKRIIERIGKESA